MITHHGHNNGYNKPVYNVHKNTGAHYTWQNTVVVGTKKDNVETKHNTMQNHKQHVLKSCFIRMYLI